MSDASTPNSDTTPASRTVSGVCRVCGERYTFYVPHVCSMGSSMEAGFVHRRVTEGLCPCCCAPGHPAAAILTSIHRSRRRKRRVCHLTLLLTLAAYGKESRRDGLGGVGQSPNAYDDVVSRVIADSKERLSHLSDNDRQALAAEARLLPRTACCPLHAQSEITRAITVAGIATPQVLSE